MKFEICDIQTKSICKRPITACKQYCLAAGATQGNIAYTQTVTSNPNRPTVRPSNDRKKKPAAHFSTFGFARNTSQPFAKPKELKFSNRTD